MQPKAIQELWDPYGRMNATLGVEMPFTNNNIQTTIPLGYIDPVTESVPDGQIQLWKITHNGVDTHPVHFHLFNVQVINRVGWDGQIRPPDANELGWKETVRMNPLEDAIIALQPKSQTGLPFAVPNSTRSLDVTHAGDGQYIGHRPARTETRSPSPTRRPTSAGSMSGTATSWAMKRTTSCAHLSCWSRRRYRLRLPA